MMPTDPLMAYAADFYPNKDKILAAMLYLMKIRQGISQYQIVKSVFLADKNHLNETGRPITFDKYVAMEQGPVPSLVYALLMQEEVFRIIYNRDAPWSFERRGNGNRYYALEEPNFEVLSQTDLEALREGLRVVQKLSSAELSKLLHDDPAYREAWSRREGVKKSVPMRAVKLLSDESEERISLLNELCYP